MRPAAAAVGDMRFVLIQPEIAANVGAALRLAACFRLGLDIVDPCGFPFDPRRFRRVAMDYGALAPLRRWSDFATFCADAAGARLALFTTAGDVRHVDVDWRAGDALLFGSESAGAPEAAHAVADLRVRIPLAAPARSLNLATAAAIALGEALRRTGGFDRLETVP